MSVFLRLHQKGESALVNADMIYSVVKKLKGRGAVIVDGGGETMEVDETVEEITTMLGELDVEIVESANDE
jgi:hypothetical protein